MAATPADFVKKWTVRFADNNFQFIREGTFREFAADIAATFGVPVDVVPPYQPGGTYQAGFLVRYAPPPSDPEAFYYSLRAGVLAAPGPSNLTDWKLVPGPIKATALSQELSLVQAQGIEFDQVVAGRTYLVDFGPDPATGYTRTIALRGISNNSFDTEGTLEVNGKRTPVEAVDVFAGTWQEKRHYTDVQARAAQLNRAAPTGSTIYLDSAERADDYGTAAGKLTIDTANSQRGVRVRFTVAASAPKPAFINVTQARPLRYVPGDIYVAGTEFNYSVLVCVDKIEVAIYP